MAGAAIIHRRHVIDRLADRFAGIACVASRARAVIDNTGMVGECAGKTFGVMAIAAIRIRYRVRGQRGRLSARVNAVVVVVARCTGLYRGIDQIVAENTTHAEAHDAVARSAIDVHQRMPRRFTRCRSGAMAGVATMTDHFGTGVVRVGTQEAQGRMAVATF